MGDLLENLLFKNKRVIVFGLPGAFTPTCSSKHLPEYEAMADELLQYVDDIYCVSVNDKFVMDAWANSLGIEKVKMLPDGNGDFARLLGMYVNRSDYGMGMRSWRCAFITDNTKIEYMFSEPFPEDNLDHDPYNESSPQNILEYLNKRFAGKCCEQGYIQPDSISIVNYSSGIVKNNIIIFDHV